MAIASDPHTALRIAAKALVLALQDDDDRGGGLISRGTIRRADELRIVLNRAERLEGARG